MMSASNDSNSNSVDPDLLTKLLVDDDADDEKFDDIELQKHENQKTASATATATSSNIKKNIVIAHAIPCDVAKQQKPSAVELYTGGGGYDGSRRRARAGTRSCCWWIECLVCTLLGVTVCGTVLLGLLLTERERNAVLQPVETFKDEINGVIGEEFSFPTQVYLFLWACWWIVWLVREAQ